MKRLLAQSWASAALWGGCGAVSTTASGRRSLR